MIYRGPGLLAVVYDLAARPPSSIISFSLFLRLPVTCVSPVELTDGSEGGRKEWARNPIIHPRESLALYKSFNNVCGGEGGEGTVWSQV
jgi:hypothetical protein